MMCYYWSNKSHFLRFSLSPCYSSSFKSPRQEQFKWGNSHNCRNKQTNAAIKQTMKLKFPENVYTCIFGGGHPIAMHCFSVFRRTTKQGEDKGKLFNSRGHQGGAGGEERSRRDSNGSRRFSIVPESIASDEGRYWIYVQLTCSLSFYQTQILEKFQLFPNFFYGYNKTCGKEEQKITITSP